MAAVSADGSTVCVLILRLNSSCSRSIALVVRTLRHWLGGTVRQIWPGDDVLNAIENRRAAGLKQRFIGVGVQLADRKAAPACQSAQRIGGPKWISSSPNFSATTRLKRTTPMQRHRDLCSIERRPART
jgi:hypothetical protein